jgi:hypothetical protein
LYSGIKGKFFNILSSKESILLLALFFIQSLSVANAINISSFWSRYKDIFLGYAVYFIVGSFKRYLLTVKPIFIIFILPLFINFTYQMLLLFFSDFALSYFSNFIYSKYLDFVTSNLYRGRIFTELYDEVALGYLILKLNQNKNKFFTYLLIIGVVVFSLFSNFRSRILMVAVSIMVVIINRLFVKKFQYIKNFMFVLIISTLIFLSLRREKNQIISRVFLQDEESVTTLLSRGAQFDRSLQIAERLLFGVGLGNYYEYSSSQVSLSRIRNANILQVAQGAEEFVHTIFGQLLAESGFISLAIFLFLHFLFLKKDFFILKHKNNMIYVSYVAASWTLMAYSLFNPTVSGSFIILYWFIRGLLSNLYDKSRKKYYCFCNCS